MTKSYVSLETKICPVCGVEFDTNGVLLDTKYRTLLDTKLQNSLEQRTATGYALCPEHQAQYEDGYIHLVVADSEDKDAKLIKIEDAIYTGEIISVKRDVLSQIIEKEIDPRFPFIYIDEEAASLIKQMAGIKDSSAPEEANS